MNVEEAMTVSYPSKANLVLVAEVKRLREQRELLGKEVTRLINCSPNLMGFRRGIGSILDEIDTEEKEMTIDEIIVHVDVVAPVSCQRVQLIAEIRRLRAVSEVKTEKINRQDKKIGELHERLDILGNMVREVSKEFGTYARPTN